MTFYVHGFGHFHPENEITNKFGKDLDMGTNSAKVPPSVLLVSTENCTPATNRADRASEVLWGDASIVTLLCTKVPSRIKKLGDTLDSSLAGHEKVRVPRTEHFIQKGRTVQMRFGE